MATERQVSLDSWRKFFRSANSDITEVIIQAINVAREDFPVKFLSHRDRIAEKLFTCVQSNGPELQPAEEMNDEDVGSGKVGGEEEELKSSIRSNLPSESNELDEMDCMVGSSSYRVAGALDAELEEAEETVGEVMRIKQVLYNHQEESDSYLLESLQRLQLIGLSVQILEATKIGKVVGALSRHRLKPIRHLVRSLIEEWKDRVSEWMKATAAVADTSSSGLSQMGGFDSSNFPPLDGEAFLASQTATFEFSKIFDGLDEDGNVRNNEEWENGQMPQPENGEPLRKRQVVAAEFKGYARQEGVVRRLNPLNTVGKPLKLHNTANKPPRPSNNFNRQNKLVGTDFGHGRPSQLVVIEKKDNNDMKAPQRNEANGVMREPALPAQDSSRQSDEKLLKIEVSKRRLQEGYRQAEIARKQRAVQVMELHNIPKQVHPRRQPTNVKPQNQIRNILSGRH